MSAQTWTQLLVFLTFGLYIAIAIRARAGSTGEFYVAGGGIPSYLSGSNSPAWGSPPAQGSRSHCRPLRRAQLWLLDNSMPSTQSPGGSRSDSGQRTKTLTPFRTRVRSFAVPRFLRA